MEKAIHAWLEEGMHSRADKDLAKQLKLPHTIYGRMLLLSHNAFQSDVWKQILASDSQDVLQRLFPILAHHLKITHIALTRPIPRNNANDAERENIVRSPSNFKPLYGDFGLDTASSPPTLQDFEAAFWVTAKQNGIYQTWAPRWTMFSRGNISEKARILALDSVAQAVDEGEKFCTGSAAVDLYAGIGYFAFSYIKAGMEQVLCWDLNAWSCEGLRRGAKANGWEVASIAEADDVDALAGSDARLLVFNESNERASEWIERMRMTLPPIRHVNCGLLPTSRASWQTAVDVLNSGLGGWIHVHENFAVQDIESKAEEVRQEIQGMVTPERGGDTVDLVYVNRLKSYAPGVMHCVLDIYIPPRTPH